MILRCGKILNNTTHEIEKKNEDFISKIPDDLITQILSLLPDKDATRTRILSSRLNHLWSFLPTLRFQMSYPRSCNKDCELYSFTDQDVAEVDRFYDSIDQTLALRGGLPIQKLFLYCSKNYNSVRLYNCLGTVVELTLHGKFKIDVPPEAGFLFPCLKEISLIYIFYMDQSFEYLISGCPALEKLYFQSNWCYTKLKILKVFSLSLKTLKILFVESPFDLLLIDTPKLEYLSIENQEDTRFSFMKPMPSLVEAYIDISESATEVLTSVLCAKVLTLRDSTIYALNLHDLNMLLFPNLVKLDINMHEFWDMNDLMVFLNSTPNLEQIHVESEFISAAQELLLDSIRNPPPTCLQFKVKEIKLFTGESVTQEEIPFIRYLLKHSSNLETFKLNGNKIGLKMRKKLLNLYRGSNLCRIEFV